MASYTVYAIYAGGKSDSMEWRYPNSSAGNNTGTGHTSSNPLDLEIGDTVTFYADGGPGGVTVSGLSIFTDNSNFNIAFSGNGLGYPVSVTRTVATGATTADTVTATNAQGTTDNFYFERQADETPDGFVSGGWVGSATTNTTYYASFTNGVTASSSTVGTYQVTGLTTGITVPISLALVSGYTATESFFSVNGGTWYSPSSTGITTDNGDIIRWRVKSGSTGSVTARYSLTIGDVSRTLSVATPASYSISVSPTSVAGLGSVTVSWSATTSGTYYYNSTYFGSGTLGTGTSGTKTLTASNSFSGSSTTDTIALKTGSSSGTTQATSSTVTIYRKPGNPSIATSNVTSSSFTATATAGSPNVGTLQVSINNSNWFTSPRTFTGLTANQTYTVYARQVNNIAISNTVSTSVTTQSGVSYSVSASPTSINEGQSTTWTVTYSGITSARTVNYTISGINSSDLSSGSLTGSFSISSGSGTATTSITLQNDSATEGTETATLTLDSTDSTGASTGSSPPSASVTIADTSNQGGSSGNSGSIGGGSAETYGLSITNVAGTSVIINNNSRLGTVLNSSSITINNSNQSGQLFTSSSNGGAVNCSDNTIIGMHTIWTGSAWLHPVVTRNSSTGITVTRLNFGGSDPNNFYGGTLTISLIRY